VLKYIFPILINIVLLQQTAYTQNTNLRYEILLNKGMLKDSVLYGSLSNCLDISPKQFITLSNGTQMYLLGWGGTTPIGNRSKQTISGFAYTSDGLLLAVRYMDLCFINKEGNWESLIKLPAPDMSISSGKEVIYVYDNVHNTGMYNAYALAKAGRYKNLFVSPRPIKGICELGDSIYVAIENGIYSYSPQKNKLTLLMALKKGMAITSLTVDPKLEILYFSTQSAIYAHKKNALVMLTKEFPGTTVKYFGNGLLIFNALSKDIIRIVNVESSIEF
jgi:hypothetical protein